jgi:uncharacterized protein (TIGR01370 family)
MRAALLAAALAVLAAPAAVHAAPSDPRLAGVEDFAFALGIDPNTDAAAARLAGYDLVVVDAEQAKSGRVARLRAGGAVVLGYLSVGTIEPYRSWYPRLKPFRLKSRFEEFDEFYADVNDRGFRREIANRIAPRLLRKGFDGLFLDNTDMVEGHGAQRPGMRRLVRRLSAVVRRRGGLLFSQNGERTIGPLLRFYDGWNREDVSWTYSFKRKRYARRTPAQLAEAQAALRRISAAGLLVTASDYTAGDAAAEQESVANACAAGAVPFVSDIGLRRLPAAPLACP